MTINYQILKKWLISTHNFYRFISSRIQTDNILRVASSLSYTSLIAIVPLIAIGLAIFSAFPVFNEIKDQLQGTLVQNLVPSIGKEVTIYFNEFISATAKLTTVGVIGIAVTAILLLSTIENSFNYIFKVYKPRNIKTKITLYWTVVTLGPLLYGVGFSMRGYFYTLQKFMPESIASTSILQSILPTLFTLLALMLVYILVPNKKVRFWHAFWGAIIAVVGFFIMRKFFGAFIASSVAYTTLYGALAAVPLLLVWLYLNWAVVILGAAVTAALGEYKESEEEKNDEKTKRNYHRNIKKYNYQKKYLPKEHK
ncbi:MAG: YihY family inner membrane protein [Alphaproteobacteria bacterium]|nr:YihY family inner membrane protein [Alphaproteobacteria bacterium]